MGLWRAGVVVLSAIAVGCADGGSPAVPSTPEGVTLLDGGPVYAVCPPSLEPKFNSIVSQMLSTDSCGSDRAACHNYREAGVPPGLLDYALDASAVYVELLGPDGGGVLAGNQAGTEGHMKDAGRFLRVAPGDAGGSYLYIKMTLNTITDPRYGAGMPYDHPGSVCPATLQAVRDWIDQGAANN